MTFARLPWFIAAVALALVALLGWAYAGARREAHEAQRIAEAEKLRSQKVIVAEQATRAEVEKLAKELQGQNADLKQEIERVAKLIKGASIDSAHHVVIQGTVSGPARHSPSPAPGAAPRSPRAVPQELRLPQRPPRSSAAPRLIVPASLTRLAFAAAPPGADPAPAGVGGNSGALERSPGLVLGAPRRGPEGPVARDVAPAGGAPMPPSAAAPTEECVLANGDEVVVTVDEIEYRTKAGNHVLVGAARVDRLKPEPQGTIFRGKFDADATRVVDVMKKDGNRGMGWGFGVHAAAWDGGQTVGPAVAFPSARLFGHALEGLVTVGVYPKFQAGATALARW